MKIKNIKKKVSTVFKVNDYVMYGRTGVCQVAEIKHGKFINDSNIEYYVLHPVFSDNSIIMTPIKNRKVPMRKVSTEEEVFSLIKLIPNQEINWIDNDKERNENFKSLLRDGKCTDFIKIINTINLESKERKLLGKKIYQRDKETLREAKKLLFQEFSIALGILPDEVEEFIEKRIS